MDHFKARATWLIPVVAALWNLQSPPARAFPVEVAEAPLTTLPLTVSAIHSAQQSLLVNIYELSSSEIADALLERINAGVHVEIIEEGQPVGGLSAAAQGIQAQLVQAMKGATSHSHLFEMTSHARGKRRFRFDHGKYAVVDGANLLIGSENYSPTGNAQPGTKGNRGWEVFLHDAGIAAEYETIFRADSDMSAGDMLDLTLQSEPPVAGEIPPSPGGDPLALWFDPTHGAQPGEPAFSPWDQPTSLEASAVARVSSPDTSLSGLLALINSAQSTLDIEQMTFDSAWGKTGAQSPLLDAVIAAARRGVKVRVLLNDEHVFDHAGHSSRPKNRPTVDVLNQLSRDEGLNISAEIADILAMHVSYIHNKGVLVDGTTTLISSINWDWNSVMNNREAAALITSPAVFQHYETLFDSDWKLSAGRKLSLDINLLDCPTRLRVTAQIGQLTISDPQDESFSSLSNTRIDSTFVRASGARGCVLSDIGAVATRTGKARFVQIRKKSDGSRSVVLEGYTPKGKLYSVRATLEPHQSLDGTYDAAVYDGSGPSRERLGSALMGLWP